MDRPSRLSWTESRFILTIIAITALLSTPATLAGAQEATPAATPMAGESLDERIAAIPPEELLRALLGTPVATGTFPAEFGIVTTEPWEDEGDTDLDGTVGGVFVTSDDTLLGVYIVHPSEESATTRFEETLVEEATPFEVAEPTAPERVTVAGLPAWLINTDEIDGTTLCALRVENVILAGAVVPGFATPVAEGTVATPASAAENLAVTEALIVHLDRVSQDI